MSLNLPDRKEIRSSNHSVTVRTGCVTQLKNLTLEFSGLKRFSVKEKASLFKYLLSHQIHRILISKILWK